jgi:peptidyl-dipeptidase A
VTARTFAPSFWPLGLVATVACGGASSRSVGPSMAPTVEEARAFMDDVEKQLRPLWVARDRAGWVNENFITDDTEALAASAEDATAGYTGDAIRRSRRFDATRAAMPPDLARKFYLLTTAQTIPAPSDAGRRSELAQIETWMTSAYGKGEYCPPAGSPLIRYFKADADKVPAASAPSTSAPSTSAPSTSAPPNPAPCLHLDTLSRILAKSRNFDELVEAWRGWHAIAAPMKDAYTRYVDLANEGARDIGFTDVGASWRAGYDMPPADLEADVERLWADVKPLYEALHCFVRGKLQARYGKYRVSDHAPIPAELLGNMWAQEWNNIYDLVTPYPDEPSIDVTRALESEHWDAEKMVRYGERFFTGLGFSPLPDTFWKRSLFVRPRDRDVVCHASAWDVTWSGDLRVKMCIESTEEDFVTIHHELGHDFYFQRYGALPILFQQGANDGFHEAIGDTMALSVTPDYLASIGLSSGVAASRAPPSDRARINAQLKMALDKVAFLPFGLLIDKWRWEVFSGRVHPDGYNAAWWNLRNEIQGVSAPVARTERDFDPGAKFHVASSTPYLRYFLARIYQFQFHRALCQAAGYSGPLDQCSIHDNKAAGAKLMAMLSLGASRPWPDAMEALGAGRKADAGAMLEYFAPLERWLAAENQGKSCGW